MLALFQTHPVEHYCKHLNEQFSHRDFLTGGKGWSWRYPRVFQLRRDTSKPPLTADIWHWRRQNDLIKPEVSRNLCYIYYVNTVETKSLSLHWAHQKMKSHAGTTFKLVCVLYLTRPVLNLGGSMWTFSTQATDSRMQHSQKWEAGVTQHYLFWSFVLKGYFTLKKEGFLTCVLHALGLHQHYYPIIRGGKRAVRGHPALPLPKGIID